MVFIERFEWLRLPRRLSWMRAMLVSCVCFFVSFAPLILPRVRVLLRWSLIPGEAVQTVPWMLLWFVVAFVLCCCIVAVLLNISLRQAAPWWGVVCAVTLALSWVAALGLILLYRFAVAPRFTDFF